MVYLEPLVFFLATFAFLFLALPHIRLYVDPNLPRKYKPGDEVEALTALAMLSGFLAYIFSVFLTSSLGFESLAIGFGTGLGIALHPFYLLHLVRKRKEEELKSIEFRKFDKLIVEMAMKCGGVLSPLHLVKELDITIEDAVDLLERFVKLEEKNVRVVERKQVPDIGTVYMFRSVMALLADTDRRIIEILIEYPDGLTKSELLTKIDIPLESLEESLSRLESKGIIILSPLEDRYRLRGLTY